MQNTRVVTVPKNEITSVKTGLLSVVSGLEDRQVQSPILWQVAREGYGVVTGYGSGKVVIQSAKKEWIEEVAGALGDNSDKQENFRAHIGVDETGKGDFFGPLVVGALFAGSAAEEAHLRSMGVRDSKKISDPEIAEIAKNIMGSFSHHSVLVISPSEYNEIYRKVRNANKVLADGHAKAIEEVLDTVPAGKCGLVVVDQFSKSKSRVLDALLENGSKMEIIQMHGGESDVVVAAASILARARFVEEMDRMGDEYGVTFPKGASEVVEFGKDFVRSHGVDALDSVAKTSFKTALQITSTFDI